MLNQSMSFPAKLNSLKDALHFVDLFIAPLEGCALWKLKVLTSVEEIFVNIARYGYNIGSEGKVQINCQFLPDTKEFILCFEDKGIPFNPILHPTPDLKDLGKFQKIGGLGIHMVKAFMDKMEYENKDGKNILKLYSIIQNEKENIIK